MNNLEIQSIKIKISLIIELILKTSENSENSINNLESIINKFILKIINPKNKTIIKYNHHERLDSL